MRYTLTVEADSFKSARTVDFALLGTGGRPKRFAAAAAGAGVGGERAPAAPAPRIEEHKTAPVVTPPASVPAAPAPRIEERKATPAVTPPATVPAAPAPRLEEPRAAPAAAAGFVATHTLRRDILIHDEASSKRKSIGRLTKDTPVRIEEPAGFNVTNRPKVWVKVVTRTGTAGWLQAGELEEIR
jgi:hypothetical protein